MRRIAALLVCLLSSACRIDVSYDDTSFQCLDSPRCPAGYVCVEGACVREGSMPPDAAVPDAPAPDAAVAPDATPPDAGPLVLTLSFGETADDDVTGVTTDAELREEIPDNNYGGRLALGMDETPYHASLLRFDLAEIPAGATIVDASLVVWTINDPQEEGSIQAFQVLEAWDEGNEDDLPGVANHTLRQSTAAWTAPGVGPGSRDTVILADFVPALADTRWQTPFALGPVQAWVDDPAANFGMLLISANAAGRGCQFHSSESAEVARRPRLIVSFIPPPDGELPSRRVSY